MKNTTVLYHADNDGFGAAYAAWTAYGDDAYYIPVLDHKKVPEIPEGTEDLFIVDFSYDRKTCEELMSRYATVIIDHHKTAQEDLAGLPDTIFDMTKSGAVLTWEYFHPEEDVPVLLQYVQDYDLWEFALPDSVEVNLFISIIAWEFEAWDHCVTNQEQFIFNSRVSGVSLRKFRDIQVEASIKQARMMHFGPYIVPVTNAHNNVSEVGNQLCKEYPDAPFSVSYCDHEDCRTWSLRSIGDFDVSEIAKSMGGGGHKNAAGFTTPIGWPEATAPEFEAGFAERAALLDK